MPVVRVIVWSWWWWVVEADLALNLLAYVSIRPIGPHLPLNFACVRVNVADRT